MNAPVKTLYDFRCESQLVNDTRRLSQIYISVHAGDRFQLTCNLSPYYKKEASILIASIRHDAAGKTGSDVRAGSDVRPGNYVE